GDDLHRGAVVAVLVLVLPGLDAAVDDDQTALLEILADKIGLAAPRNHVEEIGLALLALAGKVAVAGNAEAGHIDAAGGGAELGVRHQAAHDSNNVQHKTGLLVLCGISLPLRRSGSA